MSKHPESAKTSAWLASLAAEKRQEIGSRNISAAERQDMINRRHAAGLTQEQAAELVYTPYRTYQDWECGRAGMHRAIWERLMQQLPEIEI